MLSLWSGLFLFLYITSIESIKPIVINTWRFEKASSAAWTALKENHSALDAVVRGCSACEVEQCDGTVGFGGSPDENGETVLDAMIMDGKTMNVGSVVGLRRVKNAIAVAKTVMEHTAHSMLSGEKATQFAIQMGFSEESLSTVDSQNLWKKWKQNNCQPNFWLDVIPNPKKNCGPYTVNNESHSEEFLRAQFGVGPDNHDTIGLLAIDANGNLAAGTSTNGATHKIPGRVADSGIPGSGCYADQDIGAAAATGDGDVMMRFSPSFLAVEEMRRGSTPTQAAEAAVLRIAEKYLSFSGAIIAMDNKGNYGAACNGMSEFPFCVSDPTSGSVRVEVVKCLSFETSVTNDQIHTNEV